MHATRALQRATGALSQTEASKLVSEAAKRASSAPKSKKGLRRYGDLIVIGLTTMVAVTALNRKRRYREYEEITEAKLRRLEMERDSAITEMRNIRARLNAEAEEGLRIALGARDGRTERLKTWIDRCFEESGRKPEIASGQQKPSII